VNRHYLLGFSSMSFSISSDSVESGWDAEFILGGYDTQGKVLFFFCLDQIGFRTWRLVGSILYLAFVALSRVNRVFIIIMSFS